MGCRIGLFFLSTALLVAGCSMTSEHGSATRHFVLVDEVPTLIGGVRALQANLIYPEDALRAEIEGRVIVQFIVDENGRAQDITVVKGIHASCDQEAIRVIGVAEFQPGRLNDRPIAVRMSLPVAFKLPSRTAER